MLKRKEPPCRRAAPLNEHVLVRVDLALSLRIALRVRLGFVDSGRTVARRNVLQQLTHCAIRLRRVLVRTQHIGVIVRLGKHQRGLACWKIGRN